MHLIRCNFSIPFLFYLTFIIWNNCGFIQIVLFKINMNFSNSFCMKWNCVRITWKDLLQSIFEKGFCNFIVKFLYYWLYTFRFSCSWSILNKRFRLFTESISYKLLANKDKEFRPSEKLNAKFFNIFKVK